jgi:signal transduction histidine kinase
VTEASLRQARILIVDDQVGNICLLQSILDRMGYTNVRGVTDPRQTVAQFESFRPDLIVLDLNMPHFDGFQVMQILGERIPKDAYLPILVLTGDATSKTKSKALASGASDFLQKPFDTSEIFMRMRNLLQTRFLHLQAQNQNQLLEQKVAERTRELAAALAELNQTQRQIVQQERLRAFSEMAGGVVHDFNNALMSVIGYSELLIADPDALNDKVAVLQYLKTMNTAGRDAAQVVSRLRDFYRPREEGEVFVAVDLNKIIEEAVPLTQPKWKDQAQASGRAITVDMDLVKVPPIAGNPSELRELLTNLIFNAVDAMPVGGTITLRTDCEDGIVLVSVKDTGTGMSEEVRLRCLEPFFSTKGDKGTGLGLSMVFGTVERHEGRLEIDSELGRGTTLRIRFPSNTGILQPGTETAARSERSLRVVVVDDDPVALDVVSKYLIADGHHVVPAASGREAVRAFRTGPFDLILTDQGMPGMTGVQLGRFIKATTANLPVILMTGFSDPSIGAGKKPTGVDVVLNKPISQQDLRRAISKVTGR